MTRKLGVVFGAGKVARGFLGHLLFVSGYRSVFTDVDRRIVGRLNDHGRYTVHVLGAPEKDTVVDGVSAYSSDAPAVAEAVRDADVVFVSVGGRNLASAAASVARALEPRLRLAHGDAIDVIVCENWLHAGREFRSALDRCLSDEARSAAHGRLGVAEATVMRSCIAPTPEQAAADPLAVQAQDFWRLEVDGRGLVAEHPIIGLVPVANFEHALERKLFTYNTANATISYLGWLRGHRLLSDAANDPVIAEVAEGVYRETGEGICRTFGYTADDQAEYAAASLRKFQSPLIVDELARQVADPLRKLGRDDRLVGAGMMCLASGVEPTNVTLGIAAALTYRNPDDPKALTLATLVDERGPVRTLALLAQLSGDDPLVVLVEGALARLPQLTGAGPA